MSIYKGEKLVAGGSVDTHFVRKPAWDQSVAVSIASLLTGYKAPADGMIVGILFTNGNTSTGVSITVNGVEIARTKAKDSDRIMNVQCIVSKDNVITIIGDDTTTTTTTIRFIPFEDSTVSESNVEVVTPELIRNLHDPDWSQAVSITAKQLAAGYTTPGRGIVVGVIANDVIDTRMDINVNGVAVAASTWKTGAWISYPGIQVPVNKNDVMTVTFVDMDGVPVQVDIASSREVRLLFVPYKAQ